LLKFHITLIFIQEFNAITIILKTNKHNIIRAKILLILSIYFISLKEKIYPKLHKILN